jgi:hypothetical protein
MNRIVILTLLCAAAVLGVAPAGFASDPKNRKPYPKQPPPPPPSPIYTPSPEPAHTEAEIKKAAREYNSTLARLIENALKSGDAQKTEAAFAILLPQLLQLEPQRVVTMVARHKPGATRDLLRNEVAQLWIARDRDAAIEWMKSLESRAEQLETARVAIESLAASAPGQAFYVAEQFDAGAEDFLEQLAQKWAEENPQDAAAWLATQPEGSRTRHRVRIERVLASRDEIDQAP